MRDIVNLLATSLPPHCHLTFLARKLTVQPTCWQMSATQATPGAPDVDVSVPNDALNRTSSMWVDDRAATRRRSHYKSGTASPRVSARFVRRPARKQNWRCCWGASAQHAAERTKYRAFSRLDAGRSLNLSCRAAQRVAQAAAQQAAAQAARRASRRQRNAATAIGRRQPPLSQSVRSVTARHDCQTVRFLLCDCQTVTILLFFLSRHRTRPT